MGGGKHTSANMDKLLRVVMMMGVISVTIALLHLSSYLFPRQTDTICISDNFPTKV